jgi:hypothetical protein
MTKACFALLFLMRRRALSAAGEREAVLATSAAGARRHCPGQGRPRPPGHRRPLFTGSSRCAHDSTVGELRLRLSWSTHRVLVPLRHGHHHHLRVSTAALHRPGRLSTFEIYFGM